MRKAGEAKERVIAAMNLPKDVYLGELLVSLVGRRAEYVENYRSILLYTDTQLKLQGKNCKLKICGKNLMIEYYTGDEMKVTGKIEELLLEG